MLSAPTTVPWPVTARTWLSGPPLQRCRDRSAGCPRRSRATRPTARRSSRGPIHSVAPVARQRLGRPPRRCRSAGPPDAGPDRDSQVSAEYAATCWPCTIAHPAATGSSVAEISPGTGVPQTARPTTSATTETAGGDRPARPAGAGPARPTSATGRRWRPPRASGSRRKPGGRPPPTRLATASGAVGVNGWAVTTPAEAYSTGQIADSAAHTSGDGDDRHRHRPPSGRRQPTVGEADHREGGAAPGRRPAATRPASPTIGSPPRWVSGRPAGRRTSPPRPRRRP